MKKTILFTALLATAIAPVHAAILITEVSAWGSGDSPYGSDWFEVTNTGLSAVNITGWKMDDSSNTIANAVALTGITSIAPGESVIFTETAVTASFLNTWFGGAAPAGLQIGNYVGGGVGLSTSGDGVNLFDAAGTRQTGVSFAGSPDAAPFATFDNAAGVSGAISDLSAAGVNGAFVAANDSTEVGSPGRIAAPVPEPSTAVAIMGGVSLLLALRRRRA